MGFLSSLHGPLALLVLCGLLFAEEVGVPLPLLPGDLLLVIGGVLIASGSLSPYLFIPLAMLALVGGALLGYTWARRVGSSGLSSLARRLHAESHLRRASRRLENAGAMGIFIGRLIPGLRVYINLVAGALGLRRRTFVTGLVPSVVVWAAVFVGLGMLVGVPIQGALHTVDAVLIEGGVLVVAGVGVYLMVRRVPSRTGRAEGLAILSRPWRTAGAAVTDVTTVGCVIAGVYALIRAAFHLQPIDGWYDAVGSLVLIATLYLLATRRGAGLTAGEALFGATYRRPRGAHQQ